MAPSYKSMFYKNPQQNISELNTTMYKRIKYQNLVELIPGMQGWLNI